MRHFASVIFAAILFASSDWPSWQAPYLIQPTKVAGAEMTDVFWAHLHLGMPGNESVTFAAPITDYLNGSQDPAQFAGNQVRFLVHDVPVSPWLDFAATFTLNASDASIDALPDGIHAVTVDVQGPRRNEFKFRPMYLHLWRGRTASTLVPSFDRDCTTGYGCTYNWPANDFGRPGVTYIDSTQRVMQGYPVDPSVTPWHVPPYQADLYQELMAPHTNWPDSPALWWEEPPGTVSAGLKFVRAFPPKRGEVHRSMYDFEGLGGVLDPSQFGESGHRSDPWRDGPRGVGWTSMYVTGEIDSTGGFAFAEIGGPVRYMKPDGEVITIAGWRVQPNKEPVWHLKPLTLIRQNEELRGTWLSGQYPNAVDYGMHEPTDVAIDSRNENVWYVAGYNDQAIWKVIVDRSTWLGTVSVLAGSLTHDAGFADGLGAAARFNGPISLTFSPQDHLLYVADQQNHAIRIVNPDTGDTTTLTGSPSEGARLHAAGAPSSTGGPPTYDYSDGCFQDAGEPLECYNVFLNRTFAKFETPAGTAPDVYVPMAIRVDSHGRLIWQDMGFASIRRIDPHTLETKYLGSLMNNRFQRHLIGWVWLDVDRYGNSGPVDGIYWSFTTSGGVVDGEDPNDRHINTLVAWLPPEGGLSKWVFGHDIEYNPDGWGPLSNTTVGHYPWMVTVDPRGGVLFTGLGSAGITRLRMRKPTDPIPTSYLDYDVGRHLWQHPDLTGSVSPSLKFGWQGHNYLGMPDLWGMAGASDDQLLTTFEIPANITSNPTLRASMLNFLRLNMGTTAAPIKQPSPTDCKSADCGTPGPTPLGQKLLTILKKLWPGNWR